MKYKRAFPTCRTSRSQEVPDTYNELFCEGEMPTPDMTDLLRSQIESHSGDPASDAYYGPIATHSIYLDTQEIPLLGWQEVVLRRVRLRQLGWNAISGVLVDSWSRPMDSLMRFLDRNQESKIRANELFLGPYCSSDDILKPGIMVYDPILHKPNSTH